MAEQTEPTRPTRPTRPTHLTQRGAKLLFGTSAALLVVVAVAWLFAPAAQRRVDLAGESVRRISPPRQLPSSTSIKDRAPGPAEPGVVVAPAVSSEKTPPPQPGFPRKLAIPALGVDVSVVSVGLKPDGSMEIPGAFEAGWYHYGPRPGDPEGSAVIAGHVDHNHEPGVFIDLRNLSLGAEVVVTDSAGIPRRFVVAQRFQVDKDDLPADELFRSGGDPMLTLITCGGEFSRKSRSYTDNIVIRAVPLDTVVTTAAGNTAAVTTAAGNTAAGTTAAGTTAAVTTAAVTSASVRDA